MLGDIITMTELSKDPIINVVHKGIKEDIRVLLSVKRYRGVLILVYSGIDTMAFIGMPEGQVEVKSQDFIEWADKYIRFPCTEQVTGEELYGARCGILHTYTPHSRLSRAGKCRILGYMDKGVPEVRYNPQKSTELVMVSVPAIVDAFFSGIDKFLIDLYTEKQKARVADERFKQLFHELPAK
jgi:hypothetical protein